MRPDFLHAGSCACAPGLLALTLLLSGTPTSVAAADEARYSLGTVQAETTLEVSPGDSVDTRLGFYNIDGNVPTIVDVSVAEAPSWCVVTLECAGQGPDEQAVALLVQPSAAESSPSRTWEEWKETFLLAPKGFVLADTVVAHVSVDGDATEGSAGVLRLEVSARWETDAGIAAPPQEREFRFDVVVGASAAPSPERSTRFPPYALLLPGLALLAACAMVVRRLLAKSGKLA